MPRTPPYCRANPATPTPTPTAPPAHEWPLTHTTTILPDPRESRPIRALPPEPTWTEAEIEWATLFFGGLPPDHDPDPPRHARADPDAPRCHGPRADTCTQAPTGPCLPRVCPGCLSADPAEAYHHHCHGKAAQTPSTCARTQATQACQGGATQTCTEAAPAAEAPDPHPR